MLSSHWQKFSKVSALSSLRKSPQRVLLQNLCQGEEPRHRGQRLGHPFEVVVRPVDILDGEDDNREQAQPAKHQHLYAVRVRVRKVRLRRNVQERPCPRCVCGCTSRCVSSLPPCLPLTLPLSLPPALPLSPIRARQADEDVGCAEEHEVIETVRQVALGRQPPCVANVAAELVHRSAAPLPPVSDSLASQHGAVTQRGFFFWKPTKLDFSVLANAARPIAAPGRGRASGAGEDPGTCARRRAMRRDRGF
jgi:hypothetical protein